MVFSLDRICKQISLAKEFLDSQDQKELAIASLCEKYKHLVFVYDLNISQTLQKGNNQRWKGLNQVEFGVTLKMFVSPWNQENVCLLFIRLAGRCRCQIN